MVETGPSGQQDNSTPFEHYGRLRDIERQLEGLAEMRKNGFPEGITREIFPNLPVEVLLRGIDIATNNRLIDLEEISRSIQDPVSKVGIQLRIQAAAVYRENIIAELLGEVIGQPNQELIHDQLARARRVNDREMGFPTTQARQASDIFPELRPVARTEQ